jgi:beta-phosphoglucomutase-like phosphatase (HAD superfamily)
MLSSESVLFPDAAACVKRCAAQVPLAIASGALEPEIERVLAQTGLREYFTAIASASDGVRGKPAPDLYLLAIAKLRAVTIVEPRCCVAIEDSRWGLEAARKAGFRCVAVTHSYAASELPFADVIVERMSDITIPVLERLVAEPANSENAR